MRFRFEVPNLACFDCGGVRLMLGIADKPEFDHPSSILWFKTGDIKEAFAVLSSRGVRFEDEPHLVTRLPSHELWLPIFRGPAAIRSRS